MSGKSTRDAILFAASDIINERSVSEFTLENVAHRAGVSKGGLLYHYPSKEAIIDNLIKMPMQVFSEKIEEIIDQDPNKKGCWTRAYIEASFQISHEIKELWSAGIVAALALNPELLGELKSSFLQWQENSENDGIDPVEATALKLVADGLWFLEIFKIDTIRPSVREQLLDRLKSGSIEG